MKVKKKMVNNLFSASLHFHFQDRTLGYRTVRGRGWLPENRAVLHRPGNTRNPGGGFLQNGRPDGKMGEVYPDCAGGGGGCTELRCLSQALKLTANISELYFYSVCCIVAWYNDER